MVKGISRRVVVVESPDPRIFEQAIFIVRNDAFSKEGITPEQVVSEACRVAKGYTASHQGKRHLSFWDLPAICYAAMGAGIIGLAWLLATVL